MAFKDLFSRKTTQLADGNATPPANAQDEIGVTGDLLFTGFENEEARTDRISIDDYRKMLDNDGTVQGLYNILTLPILALSRQITADENDQSETQANFIRQNLLEPPHKGGMETPLGMVIEQMLKATLEGFAYFERVYKIKDGKLVYKKLAHRDSKTLKLLRDNSDGFGGAHQVANYGTKNIDVIIPAQKSFLFTYGKAHNSLYGRSAFKAAYRAYDKKRRLEYLDSIALQNDAIKPKMLKRTAQGTLSNSLKAARNKALSALTKFGETRPVAYIPFGFDVDMGQSTKDGRDGSGSIERQNSEIARSILASFILLGTQGSSSVGSWSLSSDQSDMFMIALKGLIQNIEDHINWYLIPDLIDLNFSNPAYPELHFDDLTSDVQQIMSEAFQELVKNSQISDALVQGIQDKIANKLEIDTDKITSDMQKAAKKAAKQAGTPPADPNNGNNGGSATPTDDGNGGAPGSGAGFPGTKLADDGSLKWWRPLNSAEKNVKLADLNAKMDGFEAGFIKSATPILEEASKQWATDASTANNVNDITVVLPDDYKALVLNTIKNAFNYAKTGAADETGTPAPATSKDNLVAMQQVADFTINKQQGDLTALVQGAWLSSSRTNQLADSNQQDNPDDNNGDVTPTTTTPTSTTPNPFVTAVTTAISAWIVSKLKPTASVIVGRGIADGRMAASIGDDHEDSVYQWSAILDSHVCPICADLDGKVVDYEEHLASKWQPQEVHFYCRCLWIEIKKLAPGKIDTAIPAVTGMPNTAGGADGPML